MKKIYTAVDIGSDTIKFVVGEYFKGRVNILSSYEGKSKGIRKGLIVDPNLAITAIKDGIKEISSSLGININKAIVNVPDYNSKFIYVTGEVDITSEDGIISTDDINKVIKASVYSKLAQEYELITVIPLAFSVDDKVEVTPIGKSGKKLGIKGIMVSAPKKNIYSVLSFIEGSGI